MNRELPSHSIAEGLPFPLPFRLGILFLFLTLAVPVALARGRVAPTVAPDFTLPAKTGSVSLHDLRGKVVLVDFWASWCGPCRQSFPWMKGLLDRFSGQDLVIVAVNLDKDREAADAFLDDFPVPFAVAFDPAGKTAEAFHVQAMPSSFIVSRTGEIVLAHAGFERKEAQTLEDQIKEVLSR